MFYRKIMYVQGEDANLILGEIEKNPAAYLMEFLRKLNLQSMEDAKLPGSEMVDLRNDVFEESDIPYHGAEDQIFDAFEGFILSWNNRLQYVGVEMKVSPISAIFDNGGDTMDRYRITLLDGGGYFAAEDVSPRGVFMYSDEAGSKKVSENEIQIVWDALPEAVKVRLLMAGCEPVF